MQGYIPGTTWLERSRSGNAHIWVFFSEPMRGMGGDGAPEGGARSPPARKHVEVFPKNHDFERVKFGNYINLPYHGDERPIMLID